MRQPQQLTLNLGHSTGYGPDDFLPAPCNREALAWIDRWPGWPGPCLVLHGPPGSGKTHLAHIWARRAAAVWLEAADLWGARDPFGALGEAATAVVEDGDAIEDEHLLFHLFNLVRERRGGLLITAVRSPAAWPISLPDLASRVRASPEARIDRPDDALLQAVLVKQFADRQIRPDHGVVTYLASRMERSFSAAREVVTELDRASLRAKRPVTTALARAVLASLADRPGGETFQ